MTPKTIIVAHANPAVRDRFRVALQQAGHEASGTADAGELLDWIRTDLDRLDLILLDLRLSDAAGVELTRTIRNVDQGRLPVLVFAGSVSTAHELRSLAHLGVVGYVNEHSLEPHIVTALTPYLFPDNFNRRSSARVVLDIPVSYQQGSTITPALTLNLGRGGLAIRTMSPLDGSTKLWARFRLPGSTREIRAGSRVAWSDTRVGMGIQFEELDAHDQTAIDEFVGHASHKA